jgi:hypothetical protein
MENTNLKITTTQEGSGPAIVNGQTAYSWGNHASAGYVTSASIQNGQTYTAGSGLSLNSSNQFNVNIVNNLTTNSSEFVLSASQGVVLKTGIDSVISGSSLKVTDADWILITYDWSTFDGVDLDTQAYFYGAAAGSSTKLAITDGANYLGYGGGGYTITSNYSIDGGATSTPYGVGQFGGDVTQPSTGVEHVLINLKGMRNDTTRKTFKIDFKAKWYNTMYDGNVVLTFKKIIGPGDPTKTGSLWYPNSNQYFSTERAIIKGVTTGSHIDIASLIIDVNKNLIMFAQT